MPKYTDDSGRSKVAEFPGWKRQLAQRKDGTPYPDERNVRIALETAPELKGMLQYDEFSDRVELTRPLPGDKRDVDDALFQDDPRITWADHHVVDLTVWLTEQGFTNLRKTTVHDTVVLVAKHNTCHPVRQYLNDCLTCWDNVKRLDGWLNAYLAATDHPDYLKAVGPKFLIGAVARIFEPGCQMDSILVLEGKQGCGKSTAVRILAHEWARDLTGDLALKDAAVCIQSVWIGEMSELSALRRSEQEAIKGFISRRIDHYRPPYGHNAVDRPRHSVFIATTNENEYLQDNTGSRRFWPVACQKIDLPALTRDVDLLWGEAVERYREHEPWHLTDHQARRAGIVQADRQRLSTIDIDVLQYADDLLARGVRRIEMRQLLADVFQRSTREDPATAGSLAGQAARCLIRDGWRRLPPTGRGLTRVQAYAYEGADPYEPDPPEPSQPSQPSQPNSPDNGSQGSQPSQGNYTDFEDKLPF